MKTTAMVLGAFVVTTSLAGCRMDAPNGNVPNVGAKVVRVVDGDTFIASVDGKETTVDLLNVLAPVDGDQPECLGAEATKHLATVLRAGDKVRLQYDDDLPPKRKENRAAAFSAGVFVNEEVAEAGFAVAEKDSPNNPYYDRVLAGQQKAQQRGDGLFDGNRDCTVASTVQPIMKRMKAVPDGKPMSVEAADTMVSDLESVVSDGTAAKEALEGMQVPEGSAQAVVYAAERSRWEKQIATTVAAAKKRLTSVEGELKKLVAEKKAEEERQREEAAAKRAAAEREREREEAAAEAKAKAEAEKEAQEEAARESKEAEESQKAKESKEAEESQKAEESKKAEESQKSKPGKGGDKKP